MGLRGSRRQFQQRSNHVAQAQRWFSHSKADPSLTIPPKVLPPGVPSWCPLQVSPKCSLLVSTPDDPQVSHRCLLLVSPKCPLLVSPPGVSPGVPQVSPPGVHSRCPSPGVLPGVSAGVPSRCPPGVPPQVSPPGVSPGVPQEHSAHLYSPDKCFSHRFHLAPALRVSAAGLGSAFLRPMRTEARHSCLPKPGVGA